MLKQRIITALILIPIVLLILFKSTTFWFAVLTLFVCLGALWEWTYLMPLQRTSERFYFLILSIATIFGVLFIPVNAIFLFSFLWWVFALILIIFYPRGSSWENNKLLKALMGFAVIIPCWVALNYMFHQNDGVYGILYLFFLIWGADSVAYFAGKKFGRRRLAPAVSPGKTIEGVMAALLFAVLFTLMVEIILGISWQLWIYGILVALVTTIFSIIGDLFESMIKREVGVKDSSGLLPGHGGLLDRIDSLTAATPIFVCVAILLGIYLS